MKKIVAIIQARLQSTRLPFKILLPLLPNRPALDCMLERVKKSRLLQEIVVATTSNPKDQELIDWLESARQKYYVGSEQDVLDRYYRAAESIGLSGDDVVVRLTSDCPVIDPTIIDAVIQYYLDNDFDYAANGLEPYTFPDGMDTEVFSFKSLERAWREAALPSHREHVTFHFWKNPQNFKIGYYTNTMPNQANYRLTLDYPEDYELLKYVYTALYNENPTFGMTDIIQYLDANPEINKLNSRFVRNVSWQTG